MFTGAMLAASAASAQTPDLPGLDQTVAYIQERCDGASFSAPGLGQLRYSWSLDRSTSTMKYTEYWDGGSANVSVPIRFVTFRQAEGSAQIVADCPESTLITNCPFNAGGRGHYRYATFYCRERDKAVNALRHLQTLMGGPAPASDPFA